MKNGPATDFALGYVFAFAMLALPLAAGPAYVQFAIEQWRWMLAGLLLWAVVLGSAFRLLRGLGGMRRPGARLSAAGFGEVVGRKPAPLSRRGLVLVIVVAAGAHLVVVLGLYPALQASQPYRVVWMSVPVLGRYVLEVLRWGMRLGIPVVAFWCVQALDHMGWLGAGDAPPRGKLPPFPWPAETMRLTLCEVHHWDGTRSDRPSWLSIGALGTDAGICVAGAIRSGKSKGAIFPYTRQFIRMFADDPERRMGGLVLDAKGDVMPWLRKTCAEYGREGDIYPITLPDTRMNLMKRPDLVEPALAGYLAKAQENAQGKSFGHDVYWANAARELSMHGLLALRLAYNRPPTLADLSRVTRADLVAFEETVARARQRRSELDPDDQEMLDALEDWFRGHKEMAPHTRASISSNLSTMLSMFGVPMLRRSFSAQPEEETFPGFADLLDRGKIVVLSMPQAVFEDVGSTVGTLAKLAFQAAVEQRLDRAWDERDFRRTFFVADEFDRFVSERDSDFWARCAAARCCNVVALHGQTSLTKAGIPQGRVDHFFDQLPTKVLLRQAGPVNAEWAAKLCGREDRMVPSQTVSENAPRTSFSFLDRRELREGGGGVTASTSWHVQERYRFTPEVFLRLKNYQAVVIAFDGHQVLPATMGYLLRDFSDWNESWFDWWPKHIQEVA